MLSSVMDEEPAQGVPYVSLYTCGDRLQHPHDAYLDKWLTKWIIGWMNKVSKRQAARLVN